MVNPNNDIIAKLEQKIDLLVERYQAEKEENSMLRSQVHHLTNELERGVLSYSLLEESFGKLKVAKTLEASGEDVRDTKLRINQIVREIDKCIALLNR
jgi:predicted RNase H-like nuclease (RuvC/YqgF family)